MIRRFLNRAQQNRSTVIGGAAFTVPNTGIIPPIGFGYGTYAGAYVSETTALSIPAAWRSVNLIGDAVASSPLHAYKADIEVEPIPRLLVRPNALETRYDTLFSIVVSLLLRGNAYCLLGDFDQLMYPRQLKVVHPDDMVVWKDQNTGEVTYRLNGKPVDRAELMHIRGFTPPGSPVGMGVVEAQREALSHSMSLQEFASRYFSEAGVPPIALVTDGMPNDEQQGTYKQLQEEWVANHGRSRKPPVLYGGLDVKQLAFNNEDSQFLQSRQFSLSEIANMFGVPHHFIGAPGDSSTYRNVEQDWLSFAKATVRPWMIRIEMAFSDLLPRGSECQFNMDAILRADTTSRYTAHKVAIEAGFLTIDEVRAMEGYPPLPGKKEPSEPVDNPLTDLAEDDPEEGNNAAA